MLERFHQALGKRVRSVRRRALIDLDLGRPRHWRSRATFPAARNNVIAVIGDGRGYWRGMAYEAMNNAGAMNSRLIVILNDNDMSIAPPVGDDERVSVAALFRQDLPHAAAR